MISPFVTCSDVSRSYTANLHGFFDKTSFLCRKIVTCAIRGFYLTRALFLLILSRDLEKLFYQEVKLNHWSSIAFFIYTKTFWEKIFKTKLELSIPNQNGETLLHLAVNRGAAPIVEALIKSPDIGCGLDRKALLEHVRVSSPNRMDIIESLGIVPQATDKAIPLRHVNEIFPHVFLGNVFAFLSCDPSFVKTFFPEMNKEVKECIDRYYSASEQTELRRAIQTYGYDEVACTELKISFIVSFMDTSVTGKKFSQALSTFQPKMHVENRLIYPIEDDEGAWEIIYPNLQEIFDVIDNCRHLKKPLLIHCYGGVSRSATILTAYIMKKYGLRYEIAHQLLKEKRPEVTLKPWSKKALNSFEGILF